MANILNVTVRTINTLVKSLTKDLALFKFESEYYVNPTFASRSQHISTEFLFDMIKLDPSITNEIAKKQQNIIQKLLKINANDNK